MKSPRDPRLVIALILLLVAVAFLGGTMRLIRSARAAAVSPVITAEPVEAVLNSEPAQGEGPLMQDATPTEAETGSTEQRGNSLQSADTGGIIALAIVIVTTILLGSVIGVRTTSPKKLRLQNNPIPKNPDGK